jgi:hypothetical protein
MSSQEKIRRVFISDIHMGDARSINQSGMYHNYCWFYDQSPSPIGNRPEMLATFLSQYCIGDESLSEVVILGDLFDAWICPSELDPTDPAHPMPPPGQQFINIADSTQNKSVIAALRKLASQNRLKYLPGNHDMLADTATIGSIFPGIVCIDSPGGHPVYCVDGIWAEHGHWYGLFNAPYPVTSGTGLGASILPLGYFISRMAAESAWKTGSQFSLSDIVKEWLERIFSAVPAAKAGKLHDHSAIDSILGRLLDTMISDHATPQGALMNGVSGIPDWVSWEAVKARYASIYSQWSSTHANNVGPIEAIRCDGKDLWPAASLVSYNNKDARIIIFGHTHICVFPSNLKPDNPGMVTLPGEASVYVNSGAWCYDAKVCTFVETVFDPATRGQSVQLRKWDQQADGKYAASDVGSMGYV